MEDRLSHVLNPLRPKYRQSLHFQGTILNTSRKKREGGREGKDACENGDESDAGCCPDFGSSIAASACESLMIVASASDFLHEEAGRAQTSSKPNTTQVE